MNKKIAVGLTSIALAIGAGACIFVNKQAPAIEADAVVASTGKMYFNVSEFGNTYDEGKEYTNFSVWNASKSAWFTVTYEDRSIGLISVPVTDTDLKFTIVRSDKNTTDTWPDASEGSWNKTEDFTRSSTQNYGWVYSEGGYGNKCSFSTIQTTCYISVNGVKRADMDFNFVAQDEYSKVDLALSENDFVTITFGENVYGYDDLQNNEQGDCTDMFEEGEGGEIEIKSTSSYEFYMKTSGVIWAQIDSDIEAASFATDFVSGVVCDDGVTAPSTSKWGEFGVRYGKMTQGAKNIFGASSADEEGSIIEQAVAKYEYIVAKYNTSESKTYSEFMGRAVVYRNGSSGVGVNVANNDNNGLLTITIVAAAASVAAGAFILLRRKNQE